VDIPFGQCEHFSQVIFLKNRDFLVMYASAVIKWVK
jgi:hypothetical protein